MKLLSNKQIDALEVPADKPRHLKFAEGVDGAWLRIAPKTGRQTFLYTYAGRTLTLGAYPLVDSAIALKLIRAAQVSRDQGIDPQQAKQDRKAQAKADEENRRKQAEVDAAESVKACIDQYLIACERKGERAVDQKASVYRRFLTPWNDRPIRSITRRDVVALIDAADGTHGHIVARSVHAKVSALMSYCQRKSLVDVLPTTNLELPGKVSVRSRLLSDMELGLIWAGAGRLDYPDKQFIQLLALTGQRRQQISGLMRSEVDIPGRVFSWDASRMKGNVPHTLPLADEALRVVLGLPVHGQYMLSYDHGVSPMWSFAKTKNKLDKAIAEVAAERNIDPPAPFVFHDLRRCFRSGLGTLGIQRDAAEMCLSHKVGDAISQTYDRSTHMPQKLAALTAWEQHVLGVVEKFAAAA